MGPPGRPARPSVVRPPQTLTLRLSPCTITEAKRYVAEWHRHLPKPPNGGRFALAALDYDGNIRGVAIVGHGARLATDRWQATVTRVATDGARNACSFLYGGCARTWRTMGGRRLLTYTLDRESGSSLRAAGWILDGVTAGGTHDRPSRPRNAPVEGGPKQRWRSS